MMCILSLEGDLLRHPSPLEGNFLRELVLEGNLLHQPLRLEVLQGNLLRDQGVASTLFSIGTPLDTFSLRTCPWLLRQGFLTMSL